jgi:hypothetical protein
MRVAIIVLYRRRASASRRDAGGLGRERASSQAADVADGGLSGAERAFQSARRLARPVAPVGAVGTIIQ